MVACSREMSLLSHGRLALLRRPMAKTGSSRTTVRLPVTSWIRSWARDITTSQDQSRVRDHFRSSFEQRRPVDDECKWIRRGRCSRRQGKNALAVSRHVERGSTSHFSEVKEWLYLHDIDV